MSRKQPDDLERRYQQLAEQYRKLYQAVESSPASVLITDRNGAIEYVNPKFTEITGFTAEEVKGKKPRILKSGRTPKKVYQELWETITQGREWRGEFVNRKKNGDIYYENAAISPVTNDQGEIVNYVAVKEDITARKQAEAEREKMGAFLQTVIDGVPDPIMVISMDYRVLLMNKVLRAAKNHSIRVARELYCYGVSHHRDRPCKGGDHPCPLHEVRQSGEPVRVVHRHYTPDNEPCYVEIVAAPFWNDDGSMGGIIETSRDITERVEAEEKLEYMAHYDLLTGLPNRALFYDRLDHTFALAQREARVFALLFVDLDCFKVINDSLGHDAGDMLLQEAARRLGGCVRKSDTVARMGGDEFTVILTRINTASEARVVADKIRDVLFEPFVIRGRECHIGASVGISIYPDDGEDPNTLLKKADAAMYVAKEQNRQGPDGVESAMPICSER